jgi:hypothetical protein
MCSCDQRREGRNGKKWEEMEGSTHTFPLEDQDTNVFVEHRHRDCRGSFAISIYRK